MKILVLNAGSSSQKSCLYDITGDQLPAHPPHPLWEATIDWTVATDYGVMKVKANGIEQETNLPSDAKEEAISKLLQTLVSGETQVLESLSEINAVGHRVVHGGTEYSEATRITPEVQATITQLIPLAPSHNPANLQGIEAVERVLPDVPQVAVFDTAFHSQMPPEAAVYPIPYEWFEQGVRRYGFHGTSHRYCALRTAELMEKPLESLKMITCHLGNGCSLAAVKEGISVNTTMGFTPLEGLMMGTRSGSIDPAIIFYLMRDRGFDVNSIDRMLNKESGFKGVSGLSADLRTILQAMNEKNERAELAFDLYIHRLRSAIGEMLASLGGLDVLVFTAGVGENSVDVRQRACEGFEFLRLTLDVEKNANSPMDVDIATPDSAVRIYVIHTEEDWAIARQTWQCLR
ncbi:MAG: acetate kinase [Roseofilum sp. SBFL]|uniref:acetate kinase n=1 Tax=unclassified Roseofilum TaxID=2620099 RepID=UPI001B083390|nr:MULTISPECIES: acetate kinase [unclassified Roseofilum]MBP0012705.1 acetate kinase [Roseofilum sp. SID3]MBP0023006.1 acetate kinase [Roseofilum sp. SID2]MBP0039286.1 acetate kinase [Roseofilum sp. SID1]MBP0042265.1 acetate kinase [Roseofilum sp. SBFL]